MNELTISSLIAVLRKSLVYIIVAVIVFAVAAYAYCSVIAVPTYQAKASFIGGNGGVGTELEESDIIKSSDISASLALIKTYVYLLESDGVYKQVAAELEGMDYTANQLKSMTSITTRDEDSLFIDAKVVCENPEDAIKIVNALLDVGSAYIMKAMPNAYIVGVEESTYAVQNYPNTATTIVFAAVLAFILVYGICLIASMMDTTIKGEQNFTDTYDIPVLGNIPNFKIAAKREEKSGYEKRV